MGSIQVEKQKQLCRLEYKNNYAGLNTKTTMQVEIQKQLHLANYTNNYTG